MSARLFFTCAAVGCAIPAQYGSTDATPETNNPPANAAEVESEAGPSTALKTPLRAGMVEVLLAPDALTMGLDPNDVDYDNFHVPHLVELTHTWAIGETEVTHAQWETYMDYPIRGTSDRILSDDDCPSCPVHSITWHEAQAFANAVSAASNLESCFECEGEGPDVRCTPSVDPYECRGFRLPTEAEWEYAARGNESFVYPGSDNIDAVAFWEENSGDQSYPVGSLAPNGFGLYDMGGNIRERVYDAYAPYSGADGIDPVAMPDLDAPSEIFAERGGSYACRSPEIRWNRRNLVWDYDRDLHTGFRLARILD